MSTPDRDRRPPVVVVTGPTSAGKTTLAITLALRFRGEIVNCDSMQVYRGMDIGTAKPGPEARAAVPHHLLDVVDPDEDYNAARYAKDAREAAAKIHARGQTVFLSLPCPTCHTIAGTPAGGRTGPDLTHLASRRTLAAGTLPNTRGHLGGWILDPQTQKPGNKMPPVAMDSVDLQALLAYLESLRLEKGYRSWKQDITHEYTPFDAGLERFVKLEKGDFIGKNALLERHAKGEAERFVPLIVDTPTADALTCSIVFDGNTQVGIVGSGGYGHRIGKSIALAYVRKDLAAPGSRLEIEILGQRYPATVAQEPIYDPKNERLRA